MKLSQIGEFGLIDLLTGDLSEGHGVIQGVGDDTAVISVSRDKWLLFTTDMMVEGVHFSFDYSTPEQVGWKLLAVNVSDIAAMGGLPTQAVISLAIPNHISVDQMEALYRGLKEAAEVYRVSLVGGDTVGGKERLVLNLALLGEVTAGQVVYRRGAKPGDLVFVTG
ncbi:MAG: thiamine-phosphate kinase, partial [Peptococcaceae bacterium]|nr:thiamine-phosphate kinase [Peptococcaceae bacterium]